MKLYVLNALTTGFIICSFLAFKPATSIKQGIEGYVYLVTGNQMPGPGVKRPAPKGMKTTVYIYALTNISQVVKPDASSFYSSIKTKLVKRVVSDSKGHFSVQLPPGTYSVFTKKDALFYANLSDEKNNIFPVKVAPGKMTKIDVQVNYNAVY